MKKLVIYLFVFIGSIQIGYSQIEINLEDQVIMISGDIYRGKIIESNTKDIVIQPKSGPPISIKKEAIDKYYQYYDNEDTYVWINKESRKKTKRVLKESPEIEKLGTVRVREFGVNLTSLVSQFIPFGRSTTASGPYNFTLRLGKGKNLFHAQFGIDIETSNSFNDIGHFAIGLGYMRKNKVNEKFNYYSFFDLMAFGGSFNEPGDTGDNFLDDGGAGLGIGFGLEYELYKNILIGTETILYLGSPNVDFIAPVSLYLIARFER